MIVGASGDGNGLLAGQDAGGAGEIVRPRGNSSRGFYDNPYETL